MDTESGAQLLRKTWIAGVNEFIEKPKESWIAPWTAMRDWERNVLRIIWENVAPIAMRNPTIDRVTGGQLIRDAWRIAVYGVVDNPKAVYVGPWSEMSGWEQETDMRMWDAIVAAVK
jgi:hypothetical protein